MPFDRCAFVLALFESSFDRVYRFARRYVDASSAEEVAQEVFVRVLCQENLETKEVSVSYLIKIADNLLKRQHERRKRAAAATEDLVRRKSASVARAGCSESAAPEIMGRAMSRLSDTERDAVRMIVCEEMSYEHAATSLGVQVSRVNNWKFRGMRKLKEHYVETLDASEPDSEFGRGSRGRFRKGA